MTLQKGDFIEVDFTGRVKDGEVFDSTIKEELEKLHSGHDHAIESKPLIFCLGHGMFLNAIDDFLLGKPETSASYELELPPEKAFGQRDSRLVRMVPMDVFRKQNINPVPGYSLNFDGRQGKILTVSGGRVMIDFNHPLAGKTIDYAINVIRKVGDINEKIKALNEFFFRKNFDFELQESEKKLTLHVDKQLAKFAELFKDKFKEMLGLELEVQEITEKEQKAKEESNKIEDINQNETAGNVR